MNLKLNIQNQIDNLSKELEKLIQEEPKIRQLMFNGTSTIEVRQHQRDSEGLWVRAQHLVSCVCGENSVYSKRLAEFEKDRGLTSNLVRFSGVLEAASKDLKAGMFDDIRRLVRADLLDDFLAQAEELLSSGFQEAAVTLGGAVLEDTLRKLCDKHSLSYLPKTAIESLNVLLTKAQVYDGLVQKRITQLAHLRNDAAHGRSLGKVQHADAADMLKWLRRFVTDYLN